MPETSYPVVEQNMSDYQWMRIMRFAGMAIIDEIGDGAPFILKSVDNATNSIVMGSSTPSGESVCMINGVAHFLDGDKTIPIPYPTAPTTYRIGSVFDPLEQRSLNGPISLQVWNNANPPVQGQIRLPHLEVVWAPNQLLSDATIRSLRRGHQSTIIVDDPSQLDAKDQVLWGTRALVWTTGEELMYRDGWYSITDPGWSNLAMLSTYTAFAGSNPPQFRRLQSGEIELRGGVKRTNGVNITTGAVTHFATLPAGTQWDGDQWRPGTGTGARSIRIDATTGTLGAREVSFYTEDALAWFSLDGIKFHVK